MSLRELLKFSLASLI